MLLRIAAELARADETSFGGPWNVDIARQTERRPGRLLRIGVLDPLASSKNAQPGYAPPIPVADHWLIAFQTERNDGSAAIELKTPARIQEPLALAEEADPHDTRAIPIAHDRPVTGQAERELPITGIQLVIPVPVQNPGAVAEHSEFSTHRCARSLLPPGHRLEVQTQTFACLRVCRCFFQSRIQTPCRKTPRRGTQLPSQSPATGTSPGSPNESALSSGCHAPLRFVSIHQVPFRYTAGIVAGASSRLLRGQTDLPSFSTAYALYLVSFTWRKYPNQPLLSRALLRSASAMSTLFRLNRAIPRMFFDSSAIRTLRGRRFSPVSHAHPTTVAAPPHTSLTSVRDSQTPRQRLLPTIAK